MTHEMTDLRLRRIHQRLEALEALSAALLASWGYDPSRCQRSRSAHPFSCTLGPDDFRITTRVVPGQPLAAGAHVNQFLILCCYFLTRLLIHLLHLYCLAL